MENRMLVLLVALGLVTVTVPASANHLSVGGEDTIGTDTTADETPSDRSVEGDTMGDKSTPYGLGTATDCTDPDESQISPEEAQKAAGSQAFCGQLVYHQDNPDLRQTSPPDQHIPDRDLIGSFDVVRAGYAGAASLSYCYVFCDFIVGGTQVFNAVHTVGQAADLTHGPEEADRKDGDRYQTTSYAAGYASASAIVEANADTWRMNGWANPNAAETFAGFLTDADGDTIDDDGLQTLFNQNEDRLPTPEEGTTNPEICGYSPDHTVSISAAQESICEVTFAYVTDGEGYQDDGDFKDGYNNQPCKAPTYVCGVANEYWQANLVCLAGNSILLNEQNPCTDNNGPTDPTYTRFHWVVAPTQSLCGGQQEPGFNMNPDTGDLPYFAHDLDVWVPPTSVNGVDSTQGVAATEDYVMDAQNEQTPVDTNPRSAIFSALDRAQSTQLPDLPVDTAAPQSNVDKADRVEPNAEGTHGTGLSEDSQIETVSGKPSGPCEPFVTNTDEQFVDPWVNIVDTDTIWKGTYGTTAVGDTGLYLNQDPNQDNNNDPGPTPFYTEGQVGMFRDVNDDGAYSQAAVETQFSTIQQVGAYPLFWDMRVDDNGDVDEGGGCTFGFGEKRLPEMMDNATYGPQTGLVQAVYLQEPSAIISGTDVTEMPEGNNIYLFESQAIHQYRTEISGTQEVDSYVQSIVDGLKAHPDIPTDADVVSINEQVGTASAFAPQCQEDTGGFTTTVSLLHHCEAGCAGDTIATGYLAELTDDQARIGSGTGKIPFFEPDGETEHEFDTVENGFLKWTDVDPFDGNPDRNDDTNDRPQHHPDGSSPGPYHHQN